MRRHPCILVAVDEEGEATPAVGLALELGRLFEAEVHAIHVRESNGESEGPDAIDRAAQACGVDPAQLRHHLRRGHPLDEIGDMVKELAGSLLILGRHKNGRHDSILGGTARRLIRSHPCPTLVHRGRSSDHYQKILVAADLTPEALGAVRTARDWARTLNAELHLLSIFEPPDFVYEAENPAIPAYTVNAQRDEEHRILDRKLEELDWQGVTPVRHRPDGDPASEILALGESLGADLVVLGGRRHGALESLLIGNTADQVLRGTQASVLVV